MHSLSWDSQKVILTSLEKNVFFISTVYRIWIQSSTKWSFKFLKSVLCPGWKVQLAIVAQQRCYHLSEEERQDQGQQGYMLLTSSAMWRECELEIKCAALYTHTWPCSHQLTKIFSQIFFLFTLLFKSFILCLSYVQWLLQKVKSIIFLCLANWLISFKYCVC